MADPGAMITAFAAFCAARGLTAEETDQVWNSTLLQGFVPPTPSAAYYEIDRAISVLKSQNKESL